MEMAIKAVGLPAEESVLRTVFNEIYGGSRKSMNMAWYRAKDDLGVIEVNRKLDWAGKGYVQ